MASRLEMTFAQAEGASPLPRQLALGETSQEPRSYLWAYFHDIVKNATNTHLSIREPWSGILRSWWVVGQHNFIDDFTTKSQYWIKNLGKLFKESEYVPIFDFVQFVLRQHRCPNDVARHVQHILRIARAAYRVQDCTIIPVASPDEGKVITSAFADLATSEFGGARSHLRDAGQHLTAGQWADSVRESIHAVELLIVAAAPTANTLNEALKRIENEGHLNPNLKRAMMALYEFSSDERGVRHAKVFENANVDETDALYMFGACASFLSYMIRNLNLKTSSESAA